MFFAADLAYPQMWEFGVIARNLFSGIGFQHTALIHNVPSAYMPPGLPYLFCFFFLLLGDSWLGYVGILLLNTIISVSSIIVMYILGNEIYGKPVGLFSAIYASISPVYIYSSLTFSPIVYYHFFIALCFFYFLRSYYFYSKYVYSENFKYPVLLGLTLGLFLYFRAEMLVLALILSVLFLLKNRFKHAALVLFIPLLIISPWTIRNYIVFGKIIPIVTSTGYNFYTGHGDDASAIEYNKIISTFKEDSTFELKKSEFSYQTAFNYIKQKPIPDALESFMRLFDLWIFDRYRDSARNPVYLVTWFMTLLFFIAGYFQSFKNKIIFSNLFFMKLLMIFASLLVIIFFNIPRYQIQISFIMIPTAMFAVYNFLILLSSKLKR